MKKRTIIIIIVVLLLIIFFTLLTLSILKILSWLIFFIIILVMGVTAIIILGIILLRKRKLKKPKLVEEKIPTMESSQILDFAVNLLKFNKYNPDEMENVSYRTDTIGETKKSNIAIVKGRGYHSMNHIIIGINLEKPKNKNTIEVFKEEPTQTEIGLIARGLADFPPIEDIERTRHIDSLSGRTVETEKITRTPKKAEEEEEKEKEEREGLGE